MEPSGTCSVRCKVCFYDIKLTTYQRKRGTDRGVPAAWGNAVRHYKMHWNKRPLGCSDVQATTSRFNVKHAGNPDGVRKASIDHIIDCSLPFNHLAKPSFKNILFQAMGKVPRGMSPASVKRDVTAEYKAKHAEIAAELRTVPGFTVIADGWDSPNGW